MNNIVYACFSHYYNLCDEFISFVRIFSTELAAIEWVAEEAPTEHEWRSYQAYTVDA